MRFFRRTKKPELTVPSVSPLSPCIIEPYIKVNGRQEENKSYIPVSLLMKAIDNNRMQNIAVAGNYGVGKSSIINTAEKRLKHRLIPRHRFIRISLASLLTQENRLKNRDGETIENSNGSQSAVVETSVSDKQIEYSILQQILYHDRPQKTPKSRIRRIHKTKRIKPYWIAFLALLVIISLIVLLKPSWFVLSEFFDIENARDSIKWAIKWGPFITLGFVFILACRYTSRHFTLSIARVGYKDIEMKVKEEMSIFNAFMDEIVYFFESTKYDVVVFEDLDRFENRDVIFYKLRELNTILNNSRSIRRSISFVYAVLDDLFNPNERVKFFDYIVTVIPVINSLNSYDKLKECIRPMEMLERLGRNELLNLCDYFQDMRLLLNIVNEFNQFVPLLDTSVMSEKVLFGLIVYKNYIPSDFALMYNKAGVVANTIEDADILRTRIIEDKKKEIASLQTGIKQLKDGLNDEIIKLRKDFLEKGLELSNSSTTNLKVRIGNGLYLFDTIARTSDLFDRFRNDEGVYINNNGSSAGLASFAAIEKNMGGPGCFDDTLKTIRDKTDTNIIELERRIHSIQQEIDILPRTLEGIYLAGPCYLDEKLKPLNDKEKIQLVKFLFLNGYLDRHYQYYISYFYPNALNREDRNFVMKAGRHEGKQYGVVLENIDEILKRFSSKDFETNSSLLNISLVREIYEYQKYEDYRSSICKLITSTKNLDFLLAAYKSVLPIKHSFFYQLLRQYDFWSEISEYDESIQDDLREIYVRFCEVRDSKLNLGFKAWLPNHYAFLDKRWEKITPKRLLDSVFKAYDPVFTVIKLKNTPDSVFWDIVEKQRYEFSRQNFNAIVKHLGFYDQYSSASYTTLLAANVPALLQMVEKHWAKALRAVFPDTSVRENNDALVELLNNPGIPETEVRYYISKQHSRIQSANQLRDNVLSFAFKNYLVESSWENIYYYAIERGKGLPLPLLYNRKPSMGVGVSLTESQEKELCRLVVFSDYVKLAHYKELACLFTTPFNEIINLISPARMKLLIENNYIEFSVLNYKSIKNNYPSLSSLFLAKNVNQYLLSPKDYTIDKDDVIAALSSIDTKKSKCEFIRTMVNSDIAPDSEIVSLVYPFVESGNVKVNELSDRMLIGVISKADKKMRVTLGRRSIVSIPFKKECITAILQSMGGEYKRLTTNSATSSLSYSRDAIIIINELVKNGFVKGYEKTEGGILVYKR